MKKITTIFLAAFLLGACTDNGTPSGGAGSNDTPGGVLADFNYKNYPDTLTVSGTDFLALDIPAKGKGRLFGGIPYPIINKPIPAGFDEFFFVAKPKDDYKWLEIHIQNTTFDFILSNYGEGSGKSIHEENQPHELLKGKALDFTYDDPDNLTIKTNSGLCFEYVIGIGEKDKATEIYVYYQQRGPKTLKKIGYEKIIEGNEIEVIGEDC